MLINMVGTTKASLYRKKRKDFSGRRRQALDNAEEIESPMPIPSSGEGQSTSTPERRIDPLKRFQGIAHFLSKMKGRC